MANLDINKLRLEAVKLIRCYLPGWKFALRRHTGHRLGACDYRNTIIVVNAFYAAHNSEDVVLDTLLHEVAHALTPGHKHDAVWRTMAEKLGCQPDRLKTNIVRQPGRYKAVCPTCQRVFYKYRKPKYIQGYYCPECGKEHGRLNFLDQGGDRETRKSAAR